MYQLWETLAQVFSSEFCEISKSTVFTEQLCKTFPLTLICRHMNLFTQSFAKMYKENTKTKNQNQKSKAAQDQKP